MPEDWGKDKVEDAVNELLARAEKEFEIKTIVLDCDDVEGQLKEEIVDVLSCRCIDCCLQSAFIAYVIVTINNLKKIAPEYQKEIENELIKLYINHNTITRSAMKIAKKDVAKNCIENYEDLRIFQSVKDEVPN